MERSPTTMILRREQDTSIGHWSMFPTEIIQSIFEMGTETSKPTTYPVLLTSICQTWTNIAINTPSLWACVVFVNLKWSKNPNQDLDHRLASLFLQRAQAYPVHFMGNWALNIDPLIREHLHQAETIVLASWCYHGESEANTILDYPAPILRYMSGLITNISIQHRVELFAGHAPQLQHAHLHSMNKGSYLSTITSLHLDSVSMDRDKHDVPGFVAPLVMLKELKISFIPSENEPFPPAPIPFISPLLQVLALAVVDGSHLDTEEMIAIFSCPSSVHELQVEITFDGRWDLELELAIPHFPSVTSLYLAPHTDPPCGELWLKAILPHTPNVHFLTIDVSDILEEEASMLELDSATGNLYLPFLTDLCVIRQNVDARNSVTAANTERWHQELVVVLRNRFDSTETIQISSLHIVGNDEAMSIDRMRDYLPYVDRVRWEKQGLDGRHMSDVGMFTKDLLQIVEFDSAKVSSWGPRIGPLWKGFQG